MTTVNGWPLVPLDDVLAHRKEFVQIDDLKSYKRCRVQLHARGVVLRDEIAGAMIKTKQQQLCRSNEFLVAEIDAKMGGFGLVPENLDGAIVSSHYFLFTPKRDRLAASFLGYLCRTPSFQEQVTPRGTTNYAAIRPDHVLGYKIPLPPLEVQERIVTRIDRLAAKIEEAASLRRQADASAAALAASRAARLFCSTSVHVPIGEIADVRGGIQKGPHRTPGANAVRYVTVAHVQRNRILTDNPRFFEVTSAELERWRLIAGDVLIIEGNGSAEQIGRTALFRGEIPDCVHQNHVIRIRVDNSRILPEFLNAFLNSPAGQQVVQEQSRTTSGLRTLSVGRIKALPVPLPPLTEQCAIMEGITRLSNSHGIMTTAQRNVAAEIDAMLPAILDRAFKGELS